MTALTEPTVHSFIARHGLEAKLALIPWEQIPAQLREACDEFLEAWWESLDPDEPIEPSGLLDMTVAQLLALCRSQRGAGLSPAACPPESRDPPDLFQRSFQVVSYLRIEPEEPIPVTLAEAMAELDQLQLLAPESVHRIEEVCQGVVANNSAQETHG